MANLKDVVYLTEEQYLTLKTNGTITVDGITLNYDENTLYVTDDDILERVGDLESDVSNLETTVAEKSKILVNNNFVNTINFTSDPQTQLDELKTAGAQLSNPNLLINGDFRVNQRGKQSYLGSAYSVDRWRITNSRTTVTVTNTGITLSTTPGAGGFLWQKIEDGFNLLKGKTLTLSVKIDGNIYSTSGTVPTEISAERVPVMENIAVNNIIATNLYLDTLGDLFVQIGVVGDSSINIEYVKLEIGTVATPFSPRPYAEELGMCQRYYVNIEVSQGRYYTAVGYAWGKAVGSASIFIPLPTELRTTPTLDLRAEYAYKDNTSFTVSSLTAFSPIPSGLRLRVTAPTEYDADGQIIKMLISGTIDAEIY